MTLYFPVDLGLWWEAITSGSLNLAPWRIECVSVFYGVGMGKMGHFVSKLKEYKREKLASCSSVYFTFLLTLGSPACLFLPFVIYSWLIES